MHKQKKQNIIQLATSYHFSSFLNFIESYTKFELDIMFDLNLFSMSRKKPNDTSFNKCHKTNTRPPKHLPQFKETNWFWIRNHVMQFIKAISTWNYLVKHHIKHIMQKKLSTLAQF